MLEINGLRKIYGDRTVLDIDKLKIKIQKGYELKGTSNHIIFAKLVPDYNNFYVYLMYKNRFYRALLCPCRDCDKDCRFFSPHANAISRKKGGLLWQLMSAH